MKALKAVTVILCLAFLAGCSGQGAFVKKLDNSKVQTIYVEPIENDLSWSKTKEKISFFLNSNGFETVDTKQAAFLRMKADYGYNNSKLTGYVRITEILSGDIVYSGRCENPGFGTIISPGVAIWDCLEKALSGIK